MARDNTRYRNYRRENLSIIKYTGVITFEEIIEFVNILEQDEEFLNCKKRIVDFSNCKLNFVPEKMATITETINRMNRFDYQEAFIIDTPKETAFSIIYAHKMSKSGTKAKLFTTSTKALEYLCIPWTKEKWEQQINSL